MDESCFVFFTWEASLSFHTTLLLLSCPANNKFLLQRNVCPMKIMFLCHINGSSSSSYCTEKRHVSSWNRKDPMLIWGMLHPSVDHPYDKFFTLEIKYCFLCQIVLILFSWAQIVSLWQSAGKNKTKEPT